MYIKIDLKDFLYKVASLITSKNSSRNATEGIFFFFNLVSFSFYLITYTL